MIQLPTREYERLLSAGDVRSSNAVCSMSVALRSPQRTTSEVSAERRTCCRLPGQTRCQARWPARCLLHGPVLTEAHLLPLARFHSQLARSLHAQARYNNIGMLVGRLDGRSMPHSYMKLSHRLARTQADSHAGTHAGSHAGTQAGSHAGTQAGSYAAARICVHAAWQGLFCLQRLD